MSAIGVAAIAGFLIGSLGALGAFAALYRLTKPHPSGDRTWDRTDPKAQGRFYLFVGFCALGVLSSIVGFLFGGWPYGAEDDPRILWIIAPFPLAVLAWVAVGLWNLRNQR